MPSLDQQSLVVAAHPSRHHLHRSAARRRHQPRPAQAPRRGRACCDRVVDGAYAFTGRAVDELARCAALCTSRPHLVVAGPTAGRLWELRRSPRDGLVHVIAPPRSHPCREPWVRAYRTALIFDDEVVRTVRRHPGDEPTAHGRRSDPVRRSEDAGLDDRGRAEPPAVHGRQRCIASRCDSPTPGRPWAKRFLGVLDRRIPDRRPSRTPSGACSRRSSHEASDGLERQVRRRPSWLRPASVRPRHPCAAVGRRRSTSTRSTHRRGIANDNVRDDCADVGRLGDHGESARSSSSSTSTPRSIAWSPRSNVAAPTLDALARRAGRWPLIASAPAP